MQMSVVLLFSLLSLATSAPTNPVVSKTELSLTALLRDYDAVRCNNKKDYPDNLEKDIRKYSEERYTTPLRESITDITCWMNHEFKIEFFSFEIRNKSDEVEVVHIERLNSSGLSKAKRTAKSSNLPPNAAPAITLQTGAPPQVW
ncbi:Hypothetical predicted protein [Cloeon dipterum]|uniref:Neurotransmitter-gated ion-channel ligand-binding domain-containing protein n=1 Tax=Cloeon dipterum TaxID=197152 RepID=A0A8S1BVT7_9INSE|nr:Hypothetical predicted protein [Cloeon dipterum]